VRWVGLAYSLPSPASSSRRVAVWRRLRQLGAVSPTGSLYLLPDGDESREAFDWLAQEIREGGGEAMVLHAERLEDPAEARVIELSRTARGEDYRKITAEADEAAGQARAAGDDRSGFRDRLERLRRRQGDVARIDFFQAPEGVETAAALDRLEEAIAGPETVSREVPPADPALYRGRTWVTRPRPHVDRLASIWLIRRFVDPEAAVRYADEPADGEVSFDMRVAEFGHTGNLCTFETLLAAFGLGDPALQALAGIVHEIDLRDGPASPEAAGIDAVLRGWAAAGWPDAELERHGTALFEGLYQALRKSRSPGGPS
jgi:hypothetical protein